MVRLTRCRTLKLTVATAAVCNCKPEKHRLKKCQTILHFQSESNCVVCFRAADALAVIPPG